jgi:hypothetical protein
MLLFLLMWIVYRVNACLLTVTAGPKPKARRQRYYVQQRKPPGKV